MIFFHSLEHRSALRELTRSRAFTVAVLLTLAIGIGLNTAIFTLVDGVLLRPLGYRDADRIYGINTRFLRENRSIPRLGGDDYADLASKVPAFESAAYYQSGKDGLQIDGRSYYLDLANVSPRFGDVLGVQPVAGRLFRDEPDGSEVLLSAGFARDRFGSTQAALGHRIDYGRRSYSVVGVLPDGFSFPGKTSVWIELPARPESSSRTSYSQQVVARVRPGISPAQLAAALGLFSSQLQTAYAEDREKAIVAEPLQDQLVGKVRPMLHLLMGSVAVVLLIVCANIGHLQLIRALRRQREAAIRSALGATPSAILGRALYESLLLSAAGCLLALLVTAGALRLFLALAPQNLPRLADVHLNGEVLAFSFLISFVTMAATAVLPAWRFCRIQPTSALKQEQTNASESRASRRLRDSLIVGQVALTLTLAVVSVVLVRQMIEQSARALGFTPGHLIVFDTHAPYPPKEQVQLGLARLQSVLDTLAAQPGVRTTAAVGGAPMSPGVSDVSYAIHGRSEFTAGAQLPDADILPVTPAYFRTMEIPLLAGRYLDASDSRNSARVLVVSQELAQKQFPGESAIGKQIMCGYDEAKPTWWTIVGVVGSVRQSSSAAPFSETFYVPIAQHAERAPDMEFVVRTETDPAPLAAALEQTLAHDFPQVAVSSTTMLEAVGESARTQRFRMILFACFAGVSILLAALGIYGVAAYSVTQRRFEFALRFALGAQRAQVAGLTLRHGLTVTAIGIAAGLVLCFALLRIAGSLIGQLPPVDTLSCTLAALTVLLVSAAAVLIPSLRAARTDPMRMLRGE
ncbi:MAG: ABC transporter permease [Terracidiphilus sp.]|nr:ABC transporter permease [Terracidiphilus sp.]